MTFPARELLKNWDEQQSAYIAHREERYNAALDVLAMLYGEEFHVVDLGLWSRLIQHASSESLSGDKSNGY